MENLASDLFSVLRFLLPGFFAAWIFFGLSAYEKPSQFERVIQALIFTLAVQFFVSLFAVAYFRNTNDISLSPKLPIYTETIVSVICATLVGLSFALFANKDWLHLLLRKIGITKQTSYPSEWFGAFNKRNSYIVLHLKDERRLYGWPQEWPQSPEKGHFYMALASWLANEGDETYLPSVQVDGILISIHDVQFVEFMKEE